MGILVVVTMINTPMKSFKQFYNRSNLFQKFINDPTITWMHPTDLIKMAATPPTLMSSEQYDALWDDLLDNGMSTPLEVTIGTKTRRVRLDSGNHRVRLFVDNNIERVPVVIKHVANHLKTPSNGTHNGITVPEFNLFPKYGAPH